MAKVAISSEVHIPSCLSVVFWKNHPFKPSIVMGAVSLTLSKVTLQYMGDKGSRKSPSTIALDIVSRGWSTPGLRDEIYIQLCKQTTANEKA